VVEAESATFFEQRAGLPEGVGPDRAKAIPKPTWKQQLGRPAWLHNGLRRWLSGREIRPVLPVRRDGPLARSRHASRPVQVPSGGSGLPGLRYPNPSWLGRWSGGPSDAVAGV